MVIFMCIRSEWKRSAQADEPIPFFYSNIERIDEFNPLHVALLTTNKKDETIDANANFQHEFRTSSWFGPIVAADHKCGENGQLKGQKGFEHKNEALITGIEHIF